MSLIGERLFTESKASGVNHKIVHLKIDEPFSPHTANKRMNSQKIKNNEEDFYIFGYF